MKNSLVKRLTNFCLVLCIVPLLSGCGLGFLGGLGGLFALAAVGGAVAGSSSGDDGGDNSATIFIGSNPDTENTGDIKDSSEGITGENGNTPDTTAEIPTVPEPASLFLMGSGLAALAYSKKNQFKKKMS